MATEYEIRITDQLGRRLDVFGAHEWSSFQLVRAVNQIGSGQFLLPYTSNWEQLYQEDHRISVLASVGGGPLRQVHDTAYLIRAVEVGDEPGQQYVRLECPDLNDPIRQRGIPYYDTTAQAVKTGPAGNVILALARENLGAAANDYDGTAANRGIPAGTLEVAPDRNVGATVSIAVAWRPNLLEVMQEIVATSRQQGVYLAFDMVSRANQPILFDVFTGQRGSDRRQTVLSREGGGLLSIRYRNDWRGVLSTAYATGDGAGFDRRVARLFLQARLGQSPFGWRETIISAQGDPDAPLYAPAELGAALQQARPAGMYMAEFAQSADGLCYGRDLFFGDRVTVRGVGREFVSRLDAVTLAVDQGGEKITAVLQNEADL